MDNEKQRDNCLKEVQLHQVRRGILLISAVARPPEHSKISELVHW